MSNGNTASVDYKQASTANKEAVLYPLTAFSARQLAFFCFAKERFYYHGGMSDEKQRHRRPQDQGKAAAATPTPSGMVRCPNCQAVIDLADLTGTPVKTCPRCHLPIEKVNLA
jgi:hypothetical protein